MTMAIGTLSTDDGEPRGRRPEVNFPLTALLHTLDSSSTEVQDVKTPSLPSWANVSMHLCIYGVFEVGNLFQTIQMKIVYLFDL